MKTTTLMMLMATKCGQQTFSLSSKRSLEEEKKQEEEKNEKGNRLLNRKFSGRGWVWASPLKLRRLVELSSPWPNGEKAFSIWTFRGFLAFFIFFSRAKAIGAETKLIKEKRRIRSPSCLLPVQCAQWLPASLPSKYFSSLKKSFLTKRFFLQIWTFDFRCCHVIKQGSNLGLYLKQTKKKKNHFKGSELEKYVELNDSFCHWRKYYILLF